MGDISNFIKWQKNQMLVFSIQIEGQNIIIILSWTETTLYRTWFGKIPLTCPGLLFMSPTIIIRSPKEWPIHKHKTTTHCTRWPLTSPRYKGSSKSQSLNHLSQHYISPFMLNNSLLLSSVYNNWIFKY